MMLPEALKNRVEEHGCDCCGEKDLPFFYQADLYFSPSKLKRKRHKDKEQLAIYCPSCFEQQQSLPYRFNGAVFQAPPKIDMAAFNASMREGLMPSCTQCSEQIDLKKIHGLLCVSKLGNLEGQFSFLENGPPLANFCEECSETGTIGLTRFESATQSSNA